MTKLFPLDVRSNKTPWPRGRGRGRGRGDGGRRDDGGGGSSSMYDNDDDGFARAVVRSMEGSTPAMARAEVVDDHRLGMTRRGQLLSR